jgi:nucleoid-associated protein YgaU
MDKHSISRSDLVNRYQTASNNIKGEVMARSRHAEWSDAAMVLALLALGIFLCFLGMGLLAQWQESAARRQDVSLDVLLGAGAASAGIGLLLWWAFSILSAGSAVLLERRGRRRAAAAARRLSPAFMQRAVVAAFSVQLIAGAAANAASAVPSPEWTPTQTQSAAAPSFAAPGDVLDGGAKDSKGELQATAPAVPEYRPTARHENAAPARDSGNQLPAPSLDPGWRPAPPVMEPGLLAGPAPRGRTGHGTGVHVTAVTVLSGDTLWDIVSAYLGPGASEVDIALEWPRWYAANRGLIGESPDVLLPGQILHAPAAS